MSASAQFLNPAEAARRLGVSAKALRLYEQRGLVVPRRTTAGWRAYGPDEMARAGEVATLRALGLSLSQVAGVLRGDPRASSRRLRRTRLPSKAGFASSPAWSRKLVAYAATSHRASRLPPASSRAS